MGPNDEQRELIRSIIREMVDLEPGHNCGLSTEERAWLADGAKNFDAKNWPLLSEFVGLLRKALIIVMLSVILALIWQGVGASAEKYFSKSEQVQK